MDKPSNFRDLGGLVGAGGRRVRPCRLLRAGRLTGLAPEEGACLLDVYNLRRVVDFYNEEEYAQMPDDLLVGVEYHHIPLLEAPKEDAAAWKDDMNLETLRRADEALAENYRKLIASPLAKNGLRSFLDLLARPGEGSLLFHCLAGKDRTGIAAAVILTVLGASRQTVYGDFAAASASQAARVESLVEEARGQGRSEEELALVRALLTPQTRHLDAAYNEAETRYGSFDRYIQGVLGVTKTDVDHFRALYLEE